LRIILIVEDYQRGGQGRRNMKSLLEFYRFVLREQDQEGPEAPADAEFGQYAFAPSRPEDYIPYEVNTPEESKAELAIKSYLVSNVKGMLSSQAGMLVKLAKQGYYKKVLDPSEYTTAYRVLEVQEADLEWILGIPKDKIAKYGIGGPGILSPREGSISGWTVDPETLVKELPHYGRGNTFVAFKASIAKNDFFGNPDHLAASIDLKEMSTEMETIAVGDVAYDQCSYIVVDRTENPTHKKSVSLMLYALRKIM
jgi:hypothetical protein